MRWAIALAAVLIAAPALAQTPYKAPRDAYGHPDLGGSWEAPWLTTLERPAAATRLSLNAREAAALLGPIMAARDKSELFDAELANPDASTLAIVRGEYRTSLIVDPADGKMPITDAGKTMLLAARQRSGADNPEQRGLSERCFAGSGYAAMLIPPAATLKQWVQTKDHVILLSEAFNDRRIFSPGGGAQLDGMGSWDGSPVARWEGESLVVETTGFRADDKSRGVPFSGFPITPKTKIVERFTRIAPDEMLYEFTVEDAVYFTRPWRAEYSLIRSKQAMYEFACHEGNYGLANILSGGREVEKAAAAAK